MGTKISQLPLAGPLSGSDTVPIVQTGPPLTVRTTIGSMLELGDSTIPAALLIALLPGVPANGSVSMSLGQLSGSDSFLGINPGIIVLPRAGWYHVHAEAEYGNVTGSWGGVVVTNVQTGDFVLHGRGLHIPASADSVGLCINAGNTAGPFSAGDLLLVEYENGASVSVPLTAGEVTLHWVSRAPTVPPPPPQPPPPPPPFTTYLLDDFVDVNGTLLTAHVMQIGPGWTVTTNTISDFTIEGDTAQCVISGGGDTLAYSDAGVTDALAETTLRMDNSGSAGLALRVVDIDNFFLAQINLVTGEMELWKKVSAVFTQLGGVPVTGTIGDDFHIHCNDIGGSVSFSCNEGGIIVVADADLYGSTNWGFYVGGASASGTFNYVLFDVVSV